MLTKLPFIIFFILPLQLKKKKIDDIDTRLYLYIYYLSPINEQYYVTKISNYGV